MRTLSALSLLFALAGAQAVKETKKCGLPDNYSALPDFAQEELRAVWKNYVPGSSCEHELLITDDIMAVLEMFENEDGKGAKSTTSKTKSAEENSEEINVPGPNNTEDVESLPEISPDSIPKTLVFPTLSPQTPGSTTARAHTPRGRTRTTTESSDEYDEAASTDVPQRTTTSLHTTTTEQFEDYEENTTAATPKPKPLKSKHKKHRTKRPLVQTQNVEEEDGADGNLQDIQGAPTSPDAEKLPFLKTASSEVIADFMKVLQDSDIPSEERRQEQIHLLAVSLLSSKQLEAYNAWSTNQRKRLREQENQPPKLSRDAREALKSLSALDSSKQRDFVRSLPKPVRRELRRYSTHSLKRFAVV